MKILGTGLQGLIGSRITELLSPKYEFENVSRTMGVDITNKDELSQAIKNSNADVIFHLAAKSDVDGCEKDKDLGENGDAWRINVLGTQNIARICEIYNRKLIYISTDFVFGGEKQFYTEEDIPNPVNWYAKTKYEGEKIVQKLHSSWIIMRIAYPYRAKCVKNDFVRAIKEKLEKEEQVSMVTDHIMTPTFIDDIALALDKLCMNDERGIYHVVGSQFISPYDAATLIADLFGYNKNLILETKRDEFFDGRARRPFRLALKNDKIRGLGVTMVTFEEGLRKVKKQL